MSREPILRVAINAPLSRLFDYLPPADGANSLPRPGCRLLVPFGRRRQTGVLLEVAKTSDVPAARLKRVQKVLDPEPILREPDLRLIRFASDYYHHPIGEVVGCALPAPLRQGKPLHESRQRLKLTADGAHAVPAEAVRRAPRQSALLELLQRDGSLAAEELDRLLPGWRQPARGLVAKGVAELVEELGPPPAAGSAQKTATAPVPNPDQAAALEALSGRRDFHVALLDGITGSGKTEVYLSLIQETIALGRQVLVLVPEIGLTPQFVGRLEGRLGLAAAVLHSSLPDSVRLATWRAARSGAAPLVLGTRSAVFAPMQNPGLIVVDEEHDGSYKQQEGLRYSARDLAIARGKQLDIPVVLGSATPSIESLSRCREGAYRRLTLPARAGGAAPPLLRLVDLNRHPPTEGLARPVVEAMRRHIDEGGQVLVFLNRRGYAPTLICRSCSAVAECRRCDARMTVHARSGRLMCHHCGAARPLDDSCAACGGPVAPLGQGTERLEDTLQQRFPDFAITRIDSDSTRARGAMDQALAAAISGQTRIMVGTQILSKGHHFPDLTLVVVINADQGLFSTDFRGTERLAQGLIQVAGRAGRESRQGEVLIQTAFAAHPFWHELLTGGYERVAAMALEEREDAAWPPFSRLALLRASSTRRADTHRFLEIARELADDSPQDGTRVLGPVAAPMERRAGRYRGQLLFQSRTRRALHRVLASLRPKLEEEPFARRVRWSIDVDPLELF
jgi:primosomal protein N' (replication factor Y) (superfamily II helicase)